MLQTGLQGRIHGVPRGGCAAARTLNLAPLVTGVFPARPLLALRSPASLAGPGLTIRGEPVRPGTAPLALFLLGLTPPGGSTWASLPWTVPQSLLGCLSTRMCLATGQSPGTGSAQRDIGHRCAALLGIAAAEGVACCPSALVPYPAPWAARGKRRVLTPRRYLTDGSRCLKFLALSRGEC